MYNEAVSTTAVVTGAGRGLGRAIAERLAQRGHHVFATDIDEGAAATTAALIGGTALRLDVRDPDAHRDVARIAGERGRLAVWVNNAGVLVVGDTWQLRDADVRRLVEINLLGTIWGCHAAVPAMAEGGNIINIASLSALLPTPGLAIYGATKWGVAGFSLSLAGELRAAGSPIRVSSLNPGAIAGDMTTNVADHPSSAILFGSKLLAMDDVADAAIALLDDPELEKTIPAATGAVMHALRPFPSIGLRLLALVARFGRR